MVNPSALQYFQAIMSQRNSSPGVLERKVAIPYSIMREASVFVAVAAINNGIDSVNEYIPLLHDALIDLAGFGLAVVTARHYGALTWPNVELMDFANSVVDLGINMKYHLEIGGQGGMPASTIRNAGSALKQFGLALAAMAGNTYFCQQDLSRVVAANMPSFQLSKSIAGGLAVEALNQSLTPGTAPGRLEHLTGLIKSYRSER